MTILERLEDDCICSFDKYTSRYVKVSGFSDESISITQLTKAEMQQLIKELQELTDKLKD